MIDIRIGDCLTVLRTLPAESVQCCVTSPPYFGLRDYGHEGQIGLEPTPEEFVAKLVDVFREVRRVLRDDGTLWLNLGDSYGDGKQLLGIPWRTAFALRADGWTLRSDIIWHKPNVMPESIRDRPTKSHEYLFLLAKSPRYLYDHKAIREGDQVYTRKGTVGGHKLVREGGHFANEHGIASGFSRDITTVGRNKRTVWTIATKPFRGAHFATFPPALVEPCIKAGTKPGDVVLDPFCGAGTTGLVASRLGRSFLGIELNPDYASMARERIRADAPLFAKESA